MDWAWFDLILNEQVECVNWSKPASAVCNEFINVI